MTARAWLWPALHHALLAALILAVAQLDSDPRPGRGGPMKLLLITLEYKASTFSGNGVYSQSIAESLVRAGNDVLVISARPRQAPVKGPVAADGADRGGKSVAAAPRRGEGKLVEMEVEVDSRNWGRLDWRCPWEGFAAAVSMDLAQKVIEFDPGWALVVDWSAVPAFSKLVALGTRSIPMAFLNFRIYYLSQYGGDDGQLQRNFYKFMESRAASMASAIAALSAGDAQVLATDLANSIAPGVVPRPLWPALRKDVRSIAAPPPVPGYMMRKSERGGAESYDAWAKERKFLTCCVRLSPEKNALMFALLVEKLAGFLAEHKITPAICGGAKEDAYAKTVKDRVKKACPVAVVYETFMGATEMADLYARTLLNVHPCVYDAYGMTIVEAGAFGTPSIVHVGKGGIVGAAELLDPKAGFAFGVDMHASAAKIAEEIKVVLRDRQRVARVGRAAATKSLSWDEDANAKQLLDILQAGQANLRQQEEQEEDEEQAEVELEEPDDGMSISMDDCLQICELSEQDAETLRRSMQTLPEKYKLSKEELGDELDGQDDIQKQEELEEEKNQEPATAEATTKMLKHHQI